MARSVNAETTFRAKAPEIMTKLMADFPIGVEDAAAILGNLGHESAGFTKLQEERPVVKGSKGGWGWAQWTGPRRRAFEAYCQRNKLDPASDKANYAYLFVELKGIEGSEAGVIGKTVAAKGLEAKVKAFELAFLRAGVKHYPSRIQWAQRAMEAWREAEKIVPAPDPAPIPIHPLPPPETRHFNPIGVIAVIVLTALLAGGFFFWRF